MAFVSHSMTFAGIPAGYGPHAIFDASASLKLDECSDTTAVLAAGSYRIKLSGTGFTYANGRITGGLIGSLKH